MCFQCLVQMKILHIVHLIPFKMFFFFNKLTSGEMCKPTLVLALSKIGNTGYVKSNFILSLLHCFTLSQKNHITSLKASHRIPFNDRTVIHHVRSWPCRPAVAPNTSWAPNRHPFKSRICSPRKSQSNRASRLCCQLDEAGSSTAPPLMGSIINGKCRNLCLLVDIVNFLPSRVNQHQR